MEATKKALVEGLFSAQMVVQAGLEPATHGFSVVSCESIEFY